MAPNHHIWRNSVLKLPDLDQVQVLAYPKTQNGSPKKIYFPLSSVTKIWLSPLVDDHHHQSTYLTKWRSLYMFTGIAHEKQCRDANSLIQVAEALTARAPLVVLWMWPCKNISHIQSSVNYFFPTSPIKLKLGTANRWETTTNSKPPEPIIMISQSEIGSSSQITFVTLFSGKCQTLMCLLPASAKCAKQNCCAKTTLLSQASTFSLFFIQFKFAGSHTEHSGGVALIPC